VWDTAFDQFNAESESAASIRCVPRSLERVRNIFNDPARYWIAANKIGPTTQMRQHGKPTAPDNKANLIQGDKLAQIIRHSVRYLSGQFDEAVE